MIGSYTYHGASIKIRHHYVQRGMNFKQVPTGHSIQKYKNQKKGGSKLLLQVTSTYRKMDESSLGSKLHQVTNL